MSFEMRHFYEFRNFRLDLAERVLLRDGKPLSITPKVFYLLKILVENHGHIVEKEKLIAELWADSFVEEGNLAFNVRMLRKALGDDASNPTFVETVPRRGYRFIAEVKENFEDAVAKTKSNKIHSNLSVQTLKKSYLSVAAISVFIIGLVAFALWFANGKGVRSASSAPILSAPFKSEKFPTTGKRVHAVISPDGKYVAYTNESGSKQSVWLRQLETSENITIVPPSDEEYLGLAFSHDGSSLYFVRRSQSDKTMAAVYRVSAFGGIPVKITEKTEGWISVSPDDKQISFVRCQYKDDDFCSLFVIDADGNNERKLLTRARPIRISANQFSPDGKSIGFAAGQSWNGGSDFRLMRIDVETSAESEISPKTFFNIRSLKWLPDGNSLLFTGEENTDRRMRIWQVSNATGEVQSLTKDATNYVQISLNKNADKMIATQVDNDFRLYLSSFDNPNSLKILTAAGQFTFAPDGKIIYSTDDFDIWTINADGSEQRQLTNSSFSDFSPLVSPDGRFVFFTSNRTGTDQVWRMNADGSNQTQLTKNEGGYPQYVTPDGKWVHYLSGLRRSLWRVSTEGGEESQVSEKGDRSPDGNFAAYFFRNKEKNNQLEIIVMSLAEKKVYKTFAVPNAKFAGINITWSSDSRTINYITASNDSKKSLWQQSLDGDQPRFIADLGEEEISGFAVSPDGNSFGFVRGKWIHEAVLIKGLK